MYKVSWGLFGNTYAFSNEVFYTLREAQTKYTVMSIFWTGWLCIEEVETT
jgi:hypothetical protein